MKKNSKGITLIALVITIIVLLILAGISIASLTGENGILTKATESKEKTQIEEEKEQIKLAYNASKMEKLGNGDTTKILAKDLQTQLDKQNVEAKATDKGTTIVVSFQKSKHTYIIDSDGNITQGSDKDESESAWEKILEEANQNPEEYKHPEQTNSTAVAIGTDGKPVNLDLWAYVSDGYQYSLQNEEYVGGGNYAPTNAYLGDDFENIIIPQYIKDEGDEKFKPVVDLYFTFEGLSEIIKAPKIPTTVTSMEDTFCGCSGLEIASEIPDGVTNMNDTFTNCIKLTIAPEIPNSVTDMEGTFAECSRLAVAPRIPSGVINIMQTFIGCTELTTAPEIPDGVTNMDGTFARCTKLTTAPKIPDSVTNMKSTFYNCTGLITAPTKIPDSVINMNSTFEGCGSLITPPSTISSSVISMNMAFGNCGKITGVIRINSSNCTSMERLIGCYGAGTGIYAFPTNLTIQVPQDSETYKTLSSIQTGNVIIEQF